MSRIGDALRTLFPSQKRDLASDEILGWRMRGYPGAGKVQVTSESALRHSAVWACLRLRANLVSTMPVDCYRKVAGVQVEVKGPEWLSMPYPGLDIGEFLWGTQMDLDRYGNTIGLIHQVDAAGRPAQVEPLPMGDTTIMTKGRRVTGYRVAGEFFAPEVIWHERQYAPAGSPIGLSPIAYAAWSIGGYLSAQQFALDWYSTGAAPSGVLRNTERTLVKDVTASARAEFKAATENREIFVTGKDWEWTPAQGDASSAAFLDEMRYGISDVCRFLDVPGDIIDAGTASGSITYANVTQRNVQLLVLSLGPAVNRRERAFSIALSRPRFVKFNTDAVLRMDPETRSRVLTDQVTSRRLAPSEARALDNREPFTEDQLAEFDRLFGARNVPGGQQQPRWAPPYVITQVRDLPKGEIESGWVPPSDVIVEGRPL